MANRPNFIDLRAVSSGPLYTGLVSPIPRALPSPKIHVAGDIPPELSPLDAFAAQSRLLAKQLKSQANRESRLPPATITRALSISRPDYTRAASADDAVVPPFSQHNIENHDVRPISIHPELGTIQRNSQDFDQITDTALPILSAPDLTEPKPSVPVSMTNTHSMPQYQMADYGAPRAQSPTAMDETHVTAGAQPSTSYFPVAVPPAANNLTTKVGRSVLSSRRSRPHLAHVTPQAQPARTEAGIPDYTSNHHTRNLAPPRSPYSQRSPSIRSASFDSQEDNFTSGGDPRSRKPSGSSAIPSPTSPKAYTMNRSPSISSQYSVASLSRPSFNFSRPISRASVTHDHPSRQASADSQPSIVFADDIGTTPLSMHGSDDKSDFLDESHAYSAFVLPRGKEVHRDFDLNPSLGIDGSGDVELAMSPADFDPPLTQPSSCPIQPVIVHPTSHNMLRTSEDEDARGNVRGEIAHSICPSISDISTIKGGTSSAVEDDSPEFHVAKGIECHEHGSLKESTYHLRIAARQNHPTGMLLYALACRHGWGMRANQKEGLLWLRKAADFAILEVADSDDFSKKGGNIDFMEQKTRKAQFALSVYELGVSHMNGWGIEQDKALALRCFEIAGGTIFSNSIIV